MSQDALQHVILRNNFYRDNYRRVVIVLLIMVVINLILGGTIFYLANHRPQPAYFATTTDGKIIRLQPLSAPIVDRATVLNWATQAAVSSYTYNFVNYRKELQTVANKYFTPEGWKAFQSELQKSRNLETVLAKKLVVHARPTGAPQISDQGVLNGHYIWKVSLPLLVTFESENTHLTQPLMVSMVITRTRVDDDQPKGIAIAQFVASESAKPSS